MKFELGKCYKHTVTGKMISIVGGIDTDFYGKSVLVAEDDTGKLLPVGSDEHHSINFIEITREEWMEQFN